MRFVNHDLARSNRCVITNLAVEKSPWVTSDHRPRRGLLDYLREKNRGRVYEADERIFRLTDEAMSNFFLYRALNRRQVERLGGSHLIGYRQVTPLDNVLHESEWNFHKDYQLYVADHETHELKSGKQVVTSWNTNLALAAGGHFCLADEAWKNWPARGWSSTAEGILYYCSMVRRFGDDFYLVSQRVGDIDSILVDRCQDFLGVKNHGRLRLGAFKQLPVFVVSVFDHRPTPSSEPAYRKPFRLDAKGLGECYDTSGGVGVSGRMVADLDRKNEGLPMWWIPVVGVVAIVAAIYGVKFGFRWMHDKLAYHKKAAAAVTAPVKVEKALKNVQPVGEDSHVSNEMVAGSFGTNIVGTNSVARRCVGYCVLSGAPMCFFSDGSIGRPPGLTSIRSDVVVFEGVSYPVNVGHVSSEPPFSGPHDAGGEGQMRPVGSQWPVPPVRKHFPDVSVAIIGQSWRNVPQQRLNGMASMNNMFH